MLKESDGKKSLGPDGFNFAFFKHFWYLVKHDLIFYFFSDKLQKQDLSLLPVAL